MLDGIADDSFVVYARGKDTTGEGNTHLYHFDETYTTEIWLPHTITFDKPVRGGIKVEIIAKEPKWGGFDTYGQIAVDWAELLE